MYVMIEVVLGLFLFTISQHIWQGKERVFRVLIETTAMLRNEVNSHLSNSQINQISDKHIFQVNQLLFLLMEHSLVRQDPKIDIDLLAIGIQYDYDILSHHH